MHSQQEAALFQDRNFSRSKQLSKWSAIDVQVHTVLPLSLEWLLHHSQRRSQSHGDGSTRLSKQGAIERPSFISTVSRLCSSLYSTHFQY